MLVRPYAAYQTFWRRFAAGLIDAFVFLGVSHGVSALVSSPPGPRWTFAWMVVEHGAFIAYSIALHARFGRTLGKWATGVIVLDVAGRGITTKQAVLRDSPTIVFSVIFVIVYLPLVMQGLDPFDPNTEMTWQAWVEVGVTLAWFGLELVTMLTNPKRRALHDFIAGTIVVRRDRLDEFPTRAAQPA